MTSLVVKLGQVPLVTSSVWCVPLMVCSTPWPSFVRFNELTYLYMFMKAFWRWLTQAPPLSVTMWMLLLGLLSVRLLSTLHISLIPFISSTLLCQIPHFTSFVSRDTCLFRLLNDPVWMPSLQWTYSSSLSLSLISFVIEHRPSIPTAFSPMCFWTAFNRIALVRASILSTFIFLLSPFWGIWPSTLLVMAGRLPFLQSQTSRFCPFSHSAGRLSVMVIGLRSEDVESHGDQSHISWRDSCTMVTSWVKSRLSWGLGECERQCHERTVCIQHRLSQNSPLSVGLATRSRSASRAIRSPQMISDCWSSVWNSKCE